MYLTFFRRRMLPSRRNSKSNGKMRACKTEEFVLRGGQGNGFFCVRHETRKQKRYEQIHDSN